METLFGHRFLSPALLFIKMSYFLISNPACLVLTHYNTTDGICGYSGETRLKGNVAVSELNRHPVKCPADVNEKRQANIASHRNLER